MRITNLQLLTLSPHLRLCFATLPLHRSLKEVSIQNGTSKNFLRKRHFGGCPSKVFQNTGCFLTFKTRMTKRRLLYSPLGFYRVVL